jgi:hypothetical protein
MAVLQADPGTTPRGGTLAAVYRWMAAIFVALVLIQAFMGGRGFFVDSDILDVHGRVGDALVLYALVHLVLAGIGAARGGVNRTSLVLSALLLVLVFVQLTLGYESEDSAEAAAWHLPNGVLIMGLTVANAMLVWGLPARSDR